MYILEKIARGIRRYPFFNRLDLLWASFTPAYEYLLKVIYRDGLRRVINNTDVIYVPHKLRHSSDSYEFEFWNEIMSRVNRQDTIADVGAFLGYYTFAFAKRVGPGGRVVAFEPDPYNLAFLKSIVKLYNVTSGLDIIGQVVGEEKCRLKFNALSSQISAVSFKEALDSKRGIELDCISLDEYFGEDKLDIVKIDVEGYEAKVLLGSRNILKRKSGYPRAIFIEVHPYAWEGYQTQDKIIIDILRENGYRLNDLRGDKIETIKEYGSIIALKD